MSPHELTARLLEPGERLAWDRAAARCPWKSFFSTGLWLEAHPKAWGALKVVGLFQNNELIAGAAFAVRRRLWQRVWTTHPLTPYAAFWIAESEGASPSRRESLHDAVVGALDRFLAAHADEALLRLDPRVRDARPFVRRGWEASARGTYLTDLDPAAEPLDAFENDARRQIAKARQAGIEVRQDPDWQGFSLRAQATLSRKGLSGRYPPGFLEQLGQALEAQGRGVLLSAFSSDGRPLASAVVVWEGDWATYLFGASMVEARGTGASSLLQAETLAYLRRLGAVRVYDWHGANTPAISQFKKNFNPRVADYLFLRKCYGLPTALAHALRGAVHRWKISRARGEP